MLGSRRFTTIYLILFLFFAASSALEAAEKQLSRQIIDSRGRALSLSQPPQRIASANLAADEILIELAQRAHAKERLLAVSTLADDPRYSNITQLSRQIPARLGGELEHLIQQKPDLVILASFNRPEMLSRLEQAGIKTFVMGEHGSLRDIAGNITTLGQLTFFDQAATTLRHEFETELAALTASSAKTGKRRSVLSFDENGVIAGKDTIFHDLVTAAGFDNLAAQRGLSGWTRISVEVLASLNPDLIIASGEENSRAMMLQKIASLPGWKNLPAAKGKRLILIPERELSAASQHVLKALQKLKNVP